jgi:hypothetical protein
LLGSSAIGWSQTDTKAEKIQALQKQLDQMKAQMESVQAQILELSKTTNSQPTNPAAPAKGPTVSATAATSVPEEENPATQSAAMRLVPERQVGQATATYQTDSQDQIAAPRIDNAPLDPRYPGYFKLPERRRC